MGLEPTVYPVTGDRFSHLNYGRISMNFSKMSFFLARKSSAEPLYMISYIFKASSVLNDEGLCRRLDLHQGPYLYE